jgi:class 3 adenylate cyclase/tetratricopeptide (TPR) repeat protein
MICPKCQFENRGDAKFCGECGHKFDISCPECGTGNRVGNKFCDECGHDLSQASISGESVAISEPHDALTTKLEPARLPEGERRRATILFSDLSGYTEMNQRCDPEEVGKIMSRIKKDSVLIVEDHGGIVNQFVGDEVLALFGIPIAHEDDPLRAVKAALELHEMVRQMSPEVEARIGKPLRMHTGINTGLIVTNPSDDRDGLYGITGDTVNTGARLKSQAESDDILISPETQRLIAPYFETKALDAIRMKGKTKRMIPYRVTKESKVHSPFEAAEQKGFKTYTGRDQELVTLHGCLEKAIRGEGQFVTVVGEAGVGKTRLLYEFRHGLDREKITVLEGRCQSYGTDTPYLPFLDAMRRGLHLRGEDNPDQLLEKAVTNIKAIDTSLEQYIPLYLHLLSISSNYQLPAHLQGKELRKAMQEALAVMNTLNTQHRPMVLILEDWHWSDETSQAALKHLIGVISPHRLMTVVTYRPDYSATWDYLSYHTPVVLKPLDQPHTGKIIKSVIGAGDLPEGLVELIHDRSGGNPLFIEEVCYSLIEEGAVVVKDGHAALTKSLENLILPDTVQAIIRTRLDRLDNDTKEALRLASVIGRLFAHQILERLYSAQTELSELLEELKALEVIQQIRVLPEAEYIFKHVLTQMVVYETLLLQRRKELHSAIGLAIEELYAGRLAEQYEVLAYHFSKGEDRLKAIEYLLKAGDKAAGAFANHEAVSFYEQALGIVGEDDQAQRANVLQKLAPVVGWAGDGNAGRRYAESALEIYEKLGDARKAMGVHMHLALLYGCLLPPGPVLISKALKHLEAAATIVEEDSDSVQKGLMYQRTAHLYLHRGQPGSACAWAQKAVDLFARLDMPMGTSLGTALTYTGSIDEGIPYNEKNWEPVLKAANPPIMTLLGHELSLTLALVRDVPRAREWGERVFSELTKVARGAPGLEGTLRRTLAIIYTLSGEVLKAEEACQAVVSIESITPMGCVWEDAVSVGFHYLHRGEWELAKEYLQRAISVFQENGQIAAVAGCSFVLGSLNLELGNHAKAGELLLKSLDICQKGGNVIFELWILPVLCELFLKMKQPEKTARYEASLVMSCVFGSLYFILLILF